MELGPVLNIVLLILGFGFVIFWHELGHFLAAKWAGVKVEQFAVGMGHALLCWRKGIGVTVGTSAPRLEKAVAAERAKSTDSSTKETDQQILDRLGISETEYRLNWLPLGGYVKMLGQDDMDATSFSPDPRSYNMKPIGKRMVIVSAGVIMNIILALILFWILFRLVGFNAPAPIAGTVMPNSPAAVAGILPGDRILSIDGAEQTDFTKIPLSIALASEGHPLDVVVDRPNDLPGGPSQKLTFKVTPQRDPTNPTGMLQIGIGPAPMLVGEKLTDKAIPEIENPQWRIVDQDEFVSIDGIAVTDTKHQFYLLDRAAQRSMGAPIDVILKNPSGQTRTAKLLPSLMRPFGGGELQFAGMEPRVLIEALQETSSARGKVLPGDIILNATNTITKDGLDRISFTPFRERMNQIGQAEQKVVLEILRGKDVITTEAIPPNITTARGKKGLGVVPGYDEANAVVANILPDSAAAKAGIPVRSTITQVAGVGVTSWHEVRRELLKAVADKPVDLTVLVAGESKVFPLTLSSSEVTALAGMRYAADNLVLKELVEPRYTDSMLTAAKWGGQETKAMITQFYLTLKRLFTGSVPASNLMGPVGIIDAGRRFAYKGTDWLVFYLALISANLAVVNFLPIPIVDGGLFVFLIIEKITGKPLSAKAQGIAQMVGLAMILSVFVFATYNDISRLFG